MFDHIQSALHRLPAGRQVTASRRGAIVHEPRVGIGLFNGIFAVAGLLLLTYYVMQANRAAASSWRLTEARERRDEVRAQRDTLIARTAQLDDRETLMGLAVSQGMVPSGGVVYLVQPDPVAAR